MSLSLACLWENPYHPPVYIVSGNTSSFPGLACLEKNQKSSFLALEGEFGCPITHGISKALKWS